MDLNDMKYKLIITFLAALLSTSGATAQEARKEQKTKRRPQTAKYFDTGGEQKLEVVHKPVSGRDLKLDLYYPAAKRSEKCPVVVFTHGGGWAAGSRYKAASESFAVVFQRLIKEGFAVAPVTYRLAKADSNVARSTPTSNHRAK
nr:hypothetical protein [uncultured bacterium]